MTNRGWQKVLLCMLLHVAGTSAAQDPAIGDGSVDCAFTLSVGDCSVTCGTGTKTVTPVISMQPLNEGALCPAPTTETCTLPDCPADGVIGSGGGNEDNSDCDCEYTFSVGPCDVTCGCGYQMFIPVISKHSRNRGRPCPLPTPHPFCHPPCPVPPPPIPPVPLPPVDCCYTLSLGPCSATCGTGMQTVTPIITRYPSNGGKECPVCTTQPCCAPTCPPPRPTPILPPSPPPVDCCYYLVTEPCCVTCGCGTRNVRVVVTTHPQNGGKLCPASFVEPCCKGPCASPSPPLPPPPVDCCYHLVYEPCCVTCGCGTRRVTVVVDKWPSNGGKQCPPSYNEICCEAPCPVDCCWHEEVGECCVSCGCGTRQVHYVIDKYPQHGGKQCPSPPPPQPCCKPPCQSPLPSPSPPPEDCCWHEEVGECCVTCGCGTQEVHIVIDHYPKNGGKPCPPPPPPRPCCKDPCPVDCCYDVELEPCCVTCGCGTQNVKIVVKHEAMYGGKPCPPPPPPQQCCLAPCERDCEWTMVAGECDATCGWGKRELTPVITQHPTPGGKQCPPCTDVPCCKCNCEPPPPPPPVCVDCEYHWETKPCSVTCGTGWQEVVPIITRWPSHGGKECPGPYTQPCSCTPCPDHPPPVCVDCEYCIEAGPCSVTCGTGVQELVPKITRWPSNGGKACPPITTQSCCKAPCGGCEWTEWSECSCTCGSGSQLRTKVSTAPGTVCTQEIESRTCARAPCGGDKKDDKKDDGKDKKDDKKDGGKDKKDDKKDKKDGKKDQAAASYDTTVTTGTPPVATDTSSSNAALLGLLALLVVPIAAGVAYGIIRLRARNALPDMLVDDISREGTLNGIVLCSDEAIEPSVTPDFLKESPSGCHTPSSRNLPTPNFTTSSTLP